MGGARTLSPTVSVQYHRYQHVSSVLFGQGSCLRCNCSLISVSQLDFPRLITVLSVICRRKKKKQWLTSSLMCVISFSGGISSPEVV